jgi:hypothetical protein
MAHLLAPAGFEVSPAVEEAEALQLLVLPDDVLRLLLSTLPLREVAHLSCTCKALETLSACVLSRVTELSSETVGAPLSPVALEWAAARCPALRKVQLDATSDDALLACLTLWRVPLGRSRTAHSSPPLTLPSAAS